MPVTLATGGGGPLAPPSSLEGPVADIFRRKQPGEAWETAVVDLSGGSGGPGTFSVTDYGAVLDGVTDDSAGIQAAIDAAWAAGGGIVLIPGQGSGVSNGGSASATNVVVNTTLDLRSGVWLRGLGPTTVLVGTANPMIQLKQVTSQDRMTISDMLLQQCAGSGIKLQVSGASQLGWPRITIRDVTVADAASHSFWVVSSGVIECRFINCVSMRSGGYGFNNLETDNYFVACTAAEGALDGFNISGGNNKLVGCKAYGNDLNGYNLVGAGRHMLVGCEAQDNTGSGYLIAGTWNTLAGCLSDTDGTSGVYIQGSSNSVNGSFMHGGGGTGQQTKSGVFFDVEAEGNIVTGVTNNVTPVGGKAEGNTAYLGAAPGSRTEIEFVTPWTPNPYLAGTQAVTLTDDLVLVGPVYKHVGQLLRFELRQDEVGGRTVTFPDEFRVNWTPDTTADMLNMISFEYDGTAWQQMSVTTGLTPRPSIGVGDTFNRENEVLNVSSTGDTWEKFNQGAGVWNVVSNQCKTVGSSAFQTNIAVLDAGVPDFTVAVTIVAQTVEAGLVWRYTDHDNCFAVGTNHITKVVAGIGTPIASGIFNFGAGDVIKVMVSGPNHFVYKNGVLGFAFSDTFNISTTKSGIAANDDGDIFDTFSIS